LTRGSANVSSLETTWVDPEMLGRRRSFYSLKKIFSKRENFESSYQYKPIY